MKKIPSLFKRDYEGTRLVYNEVVAGCEWVLAGEGIPTRKFDGTCCMVRDGQFYKRYELKQGRVAPGGFEPAQEADEVTGDTPGWVPVGTGPEDKYYREALAWEEGTVADGTYELCGPKVQGNPESFTRHVLVRHGREQLDGVPRDHEGIKAWLLDSDFEGIVWHHPDGRMAKIKAIDFERRSRRRR